MYKLERACVKSRFPRFGVTIAPVDGFLHDNVEQAAEKLRVARTRNKARFDRTHRLRLKKIEEGDWVLVYDNSLDNQHRATRKFARRWFGPYVVQSANDNGAYHLAELDDTRMPIPVAGTRMKAFKKRHDDEPDPVFLGSNDERSETRKNRRAKHEDWTGFLRPNSILAHTGGFAVRWGRMS